MQDIFDDLLFVDEIVDIRYVGEQPTIDINTEGNHLFTANGILTHNSAVSATELNHSIIAGGLSKVNTTDNYVSIIFNDLMRASGEIHFEFLKTRSADGVGKRIELKWNAKSLRIENPHNKSDGLTFVKRQSAPAEQPTKAAKPSRLADLINM